MEIDVDCLRDAKVENLERLALALGVRLPTQRSGHAYARKLVRDVLRGIELDAARARQHASAVS